MKVIIFMWFTKPQACKNEYVSKGQLDTKNELEITYGNSWVFMIFINCSWNQTYLEIWQTFRTLVITWAKQIYALVIMISYMYAKQFGIHRWMTTRVWKFSRSIGKQEKDVHTYICMHFRQIRQKLEFFLIKFRSFTQNYVHCVQQLSSHKD